MTRGVNLHFPYRDFQDRLDASPAILGKSIMMRCPQYDRRVIRNNSIAKQEEQWPYMPVEKYIPEIDPNIIGRYGEQKEYNGNEEFTGVDHGVRFLNHCNNDPNPQHIGGPGDEEEYKNRPLAWWYPASVPINTMPSDECWDEVSYVDFKLAPDAFKNEYVLEALDKFFNNKQPVKTFHVCNDLSVSTDYMNWIEDNQDNEDNQTRKYRLIFKIMDSKINEYQLDNGILKITDSLEWISFQNESNESNDSNESSE